MPAYSDPLTEAKQALHDQSNPLPPRQLFSCLSIVSSAMFIAFVDQNGISTALPAMAADLDARASISWAGTTSLVANTTFQMLYGRLSDVVGRKTVFVAAIILLALSDLLCGLSPSPAALYVFRAVAGIGGGGITNLAMIIVSDVVSLERRGKHQGIIGSMVGLGSVTGPFLAAAFVSRASWRLFFWTLAPLGTLNGLLAYLYLPSKEPSGSAAESVRQIDWIGLLTSAVGIICLLIPISGGGSYFSWKAPIVVSMLVIGSLSLAMFVFVEWKLARLPMMPVTMYRNTVIVVLVQSFLLDAAYQSSIYYVPLYLQNAHQFSIIASALMSVPMMMAQSVISTLSGLWISRYKRYSIVIRLGFALWTLRAGLSLLFHRHTHPAVIVLILAVTGIGVGFVFQPALVALQAHSAKSRRAVIISNRNFNRCAGGACGLAVSAAIIQARLGAELSLSHYHLTTSAFALPDMDPATVPAPVLDAYMAASRAVFAAQVPLVGLCLLGTVWIKDRGLSLKDDEPAAAEEGLAMSEGDVLSRAKM